LTKLLFLIQLTQLILHLIRYFSDSDPSYPTSPMVASGDNVMKHFVFVTDFSS
jgi:hypothetical protein